MAVVVFVSSASDTIAGSFRNAHCFLAVRYYNITNKPYGWVKNLSCILYLRHSLTLTHIIKRVYRSQIDPHKHVRERLASFPVDRVAKIL